MADAVSAAPKPGAPSFSDALRARLSEPERKALDRARWYDRAVSLWAPVTVLALVFLVYIVIVESAVCSYLWLQPIMKVVGALCFFWWAALVVMRFGLRTWDEARKARYASEELLSHVQDLSARAKGDLKDKALDELLEKGAAVVRSFGKPGKDVREANKTLENAADKHLSKYRRGGAIDFGGGFVKALLIALVVRTVFIEPFKIPSGSMIPTLEIGDQIFVNKFIYGVRIPFTNTVPFQIWRSPKRGDVIVFNNPVQPDKDYIKRVVGVPGDTVEFKGREVVINGKAQPVELENPEYHSWDQPTYESLTESMKHWFENDWHERVQLLSRENLDGTPHLVLHETIGSAPFDEKVVVPPASVFVMGDNRDNSLDSRFGLGDPRRGVEFVPWGNIKGKAMVVWLSLAHEGVFSGVFGGTGLRLDRFFAPVTMCGSEPARVSR